MGKITGDPNAKPCDYFDMMAGTSTGGYAEPLSHANNGHILTKVYHHSLIAIMLGRLQMTVDQCITAYEGMASKIFNAGIMSQVGNGASKGARYSADALEQAVKDIVAQYAGNPDAPMRDPVDGCKVCVIMLFLRFSQFSDSSTPLDEILIALCWLRVQTMLATELLLTFALIPTRMLRSPLLITRFGKRPELPLPHLLISRALNWTSMSTSTAVWGSTTLSSCKSHADRIFDH